MQSHSLKIVDCLKPYKCSLFLLYLTQGSLQVAMHKGYISTPTSRILSFFRSPLAGSSRSDIIRPPLFFSLSYKIVNAIIQKNRIPFLKNVQTSWPAAALSGALNLSAGGQPGRLAGNP